MNTPSKIFPGTRTTETDFYLARLNRAAGQTEIAGYSPRVAARNGTVDHATAVIRIPDAVGRALGSQLDMAIHASGDSDLIAALTDGRIRKMAFNQMHASLSWLLWGDSPEADRVNIAQANAQIPELKAALEQLDELSFALDGFSVIGGPDGAKQIVATVRGWQPLLEAMAALRTVPGWEKGGYPLDQDPLTVGQPLQVTVAGLEFIAEHKSVLPQALTQALRPYLPSSDGSMFEYQIEAARVDFVVHRHNDPSLDRLMGTVDWLGYGTFNPSPALLAAPKFGGLPTYLEGAGVQTIKLNGLEPYLEVTAVNTSDLARRWVAAERTLGVEPSERPLFRALRTGLRSILDRIDGPHWDSDAYATQNAQRVVEHLGRQLVLRGRVALQDPILSASLEGFSARRLKCSAGEALFEAELRAASPASEDIAVAFAQVCVDRELAVLTSDVGPGTLS